MNINASTLDFPDITVSQPAIIIPVPVTDHNANREKYFLRVAEYLCKMKAGEWVALKELVGYQIIPVPEKKPHFIEGVKRFIDEGIDWSMWRGNVYFNDDYTKIYKCE